MIFLDTSEYTKIQRQVLTRLISEIDGGSFRVNEPMGNELSLAERFGVSRSSMRGIVRHLDDSGVVRQVPHRGIFLQSPFRLRAARPEETLDAGLRQKYLYLRWDDSLMEVEISCGLEQFASEHNWDLRVLSVCQSIPEVLALVERLQAGVTLILVPMEHPAVEEALIQAQRRGVRILQLDRYLPRLDAPALTYDDYAVGVLATRHLIEAVNLPVWFFGYKNPVSARRRWLGWQAVMHENGYRDTDAYVVPCAVDGPETQFQPEEFFLAAFREFYQAHCDERLAIFCMCDALAVNVYMIAAEFGRRVGRDLFLVGSGDVPYARRQNPPLSSVHVDQTDLGKNAGKLLLEWPELPNYRQILPLYLEVRESSTGVAGNQ